MVGPNSVSVPSVPPPPVRLLSLRELLRFLLVGCLAFGPLLSACNRPGVTTKDPQEDAILDSVRKQVEALNRRDAETALTYVHPNAPGINQTRVLTKKMVQEYELLYMIQKLNVDSVTGDEAKVSYTEIVQRMSGGDYRSNRVTGVHTLRKDGDVWRLFTNKVLSTEYLDK